MISLTKTRFSTILKSLIVLLSVTLTFSACQKNSTEDTVQAAGIGFVHASPGTGSLDYIVDGIKTGTFNYTNDRLYYAAYPGARIVGVAKKDSLYYLASGSTVLAMNSFYTVFVIDTLKSVKLMMTEDDLSAPQTNQAKIRFINLSPDSSPLDLAIEGNNTPLFSAKAYKEYTSFTNIAPNDSYTFQLKQAGTTTVSATLPATKIEKGKIYTIWAKGLKSKTDSTQVGLSIMTNK
ncbi:DUF4397 domain-containing protein [Pedobacter sp. MW01-1-1]|uniref:DUF4397 domain-containing protein n=1 Tax=Pedobacter sp. MW01-1-1 TaxID=3383027 RepID=UPI003FEFC948